jgi:hypothetical protein
MAMTVWVPGNEHDRSPKGFRIRHGGSRGPMSLTLYNKLKKAGRGPVETVVGNVSVILPVDERAWDDARRNPTDEIEQKSIAATRARWHERALVAGKAAAESSIHVSKLKLGRRKKPPARSK